MDFLKDENEKSFEAEPLKKRRHALHYPPRRSGCFSVAVNGLIIKATKLTGIFSVLHSSALERCLCMDRIIETCVAKTLCSSHHNFGGISFGILPAIVGPRTEGVAIRLVRCKFERFQP